MKKINKEYTLSIGQNMEEKILLWVPYIRKNYNRQLKILDIGGADGSFIKNLGKIISSKHELWSVDNESKYVELLKNSIGSRAVAGNVCLLPFKDNFFDAINCSSLLHEVFTYGYKNTIGLKAVKVALDEMMRVIKDDGVIIYRDVLAPSSRELVKRVYVGRSVCHFIDVFLEKFISSPPLIYLDNLVVSRGLNYIEIYGDRFLHREIQKHYILCLENIGKKIYQDKINKNYTLDNYNSILTKKIKENCKSTLRLINEWLLREGCEKYLYCRIDELVGLSVSGAGYCLASVTAKKNQTHIRSRYNIFLSKVVDFPEIEGKQVAIFKKQISKKN